MSRTARIDVDINGEQAKARLAEIKSDLKQIKILRDKAAAEGDVKGYNQLNGEMKKLTSEAGKLERKTSDVNEVLKNISSASIRELQNAFNQAKKEMDLMKRSDPGFADKQKQVTALRTELDKATGKAKEHQTTMGSLANGFNKYFGMATALIATFTGVVFGFKKAIEEFNEFEKKVDNLSALTGLAGDDLAYLTEEAKKLSVATIEGNVRITQSADAIVDAYTKVGSARPELLKNKEDLNAVTQEAMILASAANGELQPAVDALTGVLNQFNAPASESRRIINAIAAGSKEGAGEIPYLTEAIEKSGTIAADAGISIENLVGIIETLAPRMKQPEMAGRNLRAIILKLQEGADDTNPAIVGFSKAIENLSNQNRSATELTNLFGLENITAAKILMNNREEMDNYTAAVTGTNVALEQAAINTDNNASKLEQAKNRAMLMRMELGEKLAPALTFSTNAFSYLVKGILAAIEVFNKNKSIILSTLSAIAAYIIVVNGASVAKKIYTSVVNIATAAVKAFNLTSAASPWGAIAGLIAFATVSWITFRKEVNKATKEQETFNDIQKETNKVLTDEVGQMKLLFESLRNQNITAEQRKEIITEINTKYGEYLPNLLTENSSLGDINAAYEKINSSMRAKIELMVRESKAKEIYLKMYELDLEYQDIAQKTAEQYNKENGIVEGVRGAAKARAMQQIRDDIKELSGIYEKIMSDINSRTEVMGPENYDYSIPPNKPDPTDDPKQAKTAYEQLGEAISKAKKELEAFVSTGDSLKAQAKGIVLSQLEAQKAVVDGIIKSGGDVGKYLDELTDDEAALIEEQASFAQDFYLKTKDVGDKYLADQEAKRDEATQAQIRRTDAEVAAAEEAKKKKIQLEEDWKQARLDISFSVINAGLDIYNQERERKNEIELNALNTARENELKNKNLTEEQREEIEKKYRAKEAKLKLEQWKKQKKSDIVQSLINGALAVTRAIAAPPGWPWNIPSVISAGIAAAAQTGVIVAQKPPEFKAGGFTDEDQSDDTPSGVTHANEFVANAQATRNTSVRKVLNIIDYAQKNNTIRSINLPALVASSTRQFKDGGYNSTDTGKPVSGSVDTTVPEQQNNASMITAMNRFSDAVDKLQRDGVNAKLVYLDFKKMKEKEDRAIAATE